MLIHKCGYFCTDTTHMTGIHNEKEWLQRIAIGDEDAFSAIFHRYIGILKPFAYSFTKSNALAEEIIQDSFIRVWLSRDKLGEVVSFRAWLLKIVANECHKFLKKKVAEDRRISRLGAGRDELHNPVADYINLEEVKQLISKAVGELSPQRRKIYQMSRGQGLKIEEIAAELDLSPNTVKNVLVIAVKTIREQLEEAGYVLPAVIFSIFF